MRKVLAALMLILFIAYCWLLYSWWQQGNRNFEQQRNEENTISRH